MYVCITTIRTLPLNVHAQGHVCFNFESVIGQHVILLMQMTMDLVIPIHRASLYGEKTFYTECRVHLHYIDKAITSLTLMYYRKEGQGIIR